MSGGAFTGWVDGLARTHTRRLAGVAVQQGLTGEEALDAVQEAFATFLGLPQARTLVEADDDAFALLAVIVRNAARNARRRHHRARPHAPVEDAPLLDGGPSVEALIAAAEAHVTLLGCVQRLGEIQRNVVQLRCMDELSGGETAAALGLTPGHVAVLLLRARNALRLCMAS
ncbi:MAG: sigma-70 family RNA polymerase sigma factor [Myxococcales bacterium]|nr:sigma-70 family RNA polymerase sigma factor [Myxococcales bacterium]MCB9547760.1 sigma-70 family RNA polymerase sigma factor [Myxococcales bacterium]